MNVSPATRDRATWRSPSLEDMRPRRAILNALPLPVLLVDADNRDARRTPPPKPSFS